MVDLIALDGPASAPRNKFVERSQNQKTGPAAAIYRTQDSCPDGSGDTIRCPLMGKICYAENRNGRPSPFDTAERGITGTADILATWARTLPSPYVLRLNVSGDFLGPDGRPDLEYIAAVNAFAAARPDVTIIGYSHAWRQLRPDMFVGYSVAASCDTADDIAEAIAAGWAPVTVVPETDPAGVIGSTVGGRRIVECPNTTRGVQCVDCRLCARPQRATVAFRAHGTRRRAFRGGADAATAGSLA